MKTLKQIMTCFCRKIALTTEQSKLLATIKFPCC